MASPPEPEGLLGRVRALFAHDPARYRPFVVGGRTLGAVTHAFAETLASYRDVFAVGPRAVALRDDLGDPGERTRAVADVTAALQRAGAVPEQTPEPFPVVGEWGEQPALLVDRAVVAHLGIRAFGVHLNGYVEGEEGLRLWVARRSATRRQSPGKLDHLVAGGQPAGLGIRENLRKESREEADLPADLAARAVPVGRLTYRRDMAQGLRHDSLYLFDLSLPDTFVPQNRDGEVEWFALWPVRRVVESLRTTSDWKFNVAAVVVDFLVRHGVLPADEPAWGVLSQGLARGADAALGGVRSSGAS